MTTRSEARGIVADYLRQRGRAVSICDVRLWSEITARKPPVYTPRPFRWEDCWSCYLKSAARMLTSSEIAVVAFRTGEVVYVGSARDEG